MTENETSTTTNDPAYFGACPTCGKNDGYRNVGREHWFYCAEHRTKWCYGDNIFSSWRHDGPEVFEKNARFLADFVDVDAT